MRQIEPGRKDHRAGRRLPPGPLLGSADLIVKCAQLFRAALSATVATTELVVRRRHHYPVRTARAAWVANWRWRAVLLQPLAKQREQEDGHSQRLDHGASSFGSVGVWDWEAARRVMAWPRPSQSILGGVKRQPLALTEA